MNEKDTVERFASTVRIYELMVENTKLDIEQRLTAAGELATLELDPLYDEAREILNSRHSTPPPLKHKHAKSDSLDLDFEVPSKLTRKNKSESRDQD